MMDEGNTNEKIPKNIRQIGETIDKNRKIYIEDYVIAYINRIATKNEEVAAVFLGKMFWREKCKHIFISGAVEIRNFYSTVDETFTNEMWTEIYQDIKKNFDDLEIVGWFYSKENETIELKDIYKQIHKNNFAGQDKVLYLLDPIEKEDAFYCYHDHELKKQFGYYIYYEKNEAMQNYLLDGKEVKTTEEEFEDLAVKNMRNIIAAKREVKMNKQFTNMMLYGAAAAMVCIMLVSGTSLLRNHAKMQEMQNQIAQISKTVSVDKGNVTEVETLGGNIQKVENVQTATPAAVTVPPQPTKKPEPKKTQSPTNKPVVTKKPSSKQASANYFVYVVEKGDTLSEIAEKFYKNASYATRIKAANNLGSQDKITEGQHIRIPSY